MPLLLSLLQGAAYPPQSGQSYPKYPQQGYGLYEDSSATASGAHGPSTGGRGQRLGAQLPLPPTAAPVFPFQAPLLQPSNPPAPPLLLPAGYGSSKAEKDAALYGAQSQQGAGGYGQQVYGQQVRRFCVGWWVGGWSCKSEGKNGWKGDAGWVGGWGLEVSRRGWRAGAACVRLQRAL